MDEHRSAPPVRIRRRVATVAAFVAAVALTVTGCSSSGGTSPSSSPNTPAPQTSSTSTGGGTGPSTSQSSSTSSTPSGVTEAKAAVQALLKASTKLDGPSGPVTPGTHKVAVIATGLATPGASDTATIVQQAIKQVGWSAPPTYDGKFDPATASGFIQNALTAGDEGIVLISITPSTVSSALQLTEQKKVPVVCILCGPPSTFKQFPNVIGVEPSPEKIGQAQADYAIAQTNGTGKIWIYEDAEFAETLAQNKAAIAELKAKCPGCEVHVVQMKAGDEDQPGIPVLAAVLAQNPTGSINFIIAPYDNAAAMFSTYLQQKGRTEIKVLGYAGLPVFTDQIFAGTPPSAEGTVSIPLPYMSYAAIDELARSFAGKPTWDANNLGVTMLTTSNKSEYSKSSPWTSPGFDVSKYFLKLWGK